MRLVDKVVLLMVAQGGIYEVLALLFGWETLSEAFDRYLNRWQWVKPVTLTTARHLSNDLAVWADPFAMAFLVINRFRRHTVMVVVDD